MDKVLGMSRGSRFGWEIWQYSFIIRIRISIWDQSYEIEEFEFGDMVGCYFS